MVSNRTFLIDVYSYSDIPLFAFVMVKFWCLGGGFCFLVMVVMVLRGVAVYYSWWVCGGAWGWCGDRIGVMRGFPKIDFCAMGGCSISRKGEVLKFRLEGGRAISKKARGI